jgi:hypothetical protein
VFSNQGETMKKFSAFIAVFIAGTTVFSAHAAPVKVEEPAVMPEAMLSVTVADLHGFIDGIGSVASQVSPMMNGPFIKSMIGMQVGDPNLAGIAPGAGLSVIALDTTNVFAVVEVSAAQVGAYTNTLASKGMPARYGNGLLVVGKTAEQVEKGWEKAGAVQSALLAKRLPGMRIAMKPAVAIERNQPQIQGMLAMLPMLMGQGMMQAEGAAADQAGLSMKILEGELQVLLSVAGQCDVAELVVIPSDGAVRIQETFVPTTGSRLAALCDAPRVSQANPKVQCGYLGGGIFRLDATMSNTEALMAFMKGEAAQLAEAMQLKEVDLPALIDAGCKFWMQSGGAMSETVDIGGENGISVGYLMDVKNDAEALAAVKSMPGDMKPFMKMYESFGMPMSMHFSENVRQHGEVPIHQVGVRMSLSNQPPDVAEALTAMNLTNLVYDIAVVDGIMIYAMGAEQVESIIDRLGDASFKPAGLKANDIYPDGAFYYFDFDVGRYVQFISTFMPDEGKPVMAPEMLQLLQGVEPVTSAGFKADGRVRWSVNIPGDLIARIGQISMMMQMQQMQQMPPAGAPQGIPGGMPSTVPAP